MKEDAKDDNEETFKNFILSIWIVTPWW